MTMLDIDCFEHGKTCEILATEDHNEYIAGDDVNVVQEGTKITETAKSYLIGEGNPETTDMTDAQKSHSLTLGFQNKSSFTIKMTIGDVWSYRAIMFSKLYPPMYVRKLDLVFLLFAFPRPIVSLSGAVSWPRDASFGKFFRGPALFLVEQLVSFACFRGACDCL